jgi:hypothetical protein
MALNLQMDCTFSGPALPLPFVSLNLESELNRLRLLPRSSGDEARIIDDFWPTYRSHLKQLVSQGGSVRIKNQVIDPLIACSLLGYTAVQPADEVQTREGRESGGSFLVAPDGARVRFWTVAMNEDLDAPARRGEAYRFSHTRIASRVLLATGERLGLLSNGTELRLLICDPARLDSSISIALDASWKRARNVPDSFRFFVALARPEGVRAVPELVEKARLQQAKVTKDLRVQARLAVEEFIQSVLDHPDNQTTFAAFTDRTLLARKLWREGLVTVYRLLFILKLESTDDPAKCFSFASGSLWRNTFSPGVALAPLVRAILDRGENSGSMLENGLRGLFRMLERGLQCTELNVKPMGGSLFATSATPILSSMRWPEHGVAMLLNRLLWTTPGRGSTSRERVHYGPLDVEDLGRVYEALLELDPGIASEPMCRLRRAKLEVVVPALQGERYRPATPVAQLSEDAEETDDADVPDEEDTDSGKKTKVEWIEEILPGRFYLRVGLGRKATGSFYTPHSFVRFLVQETLGPLVERVSPREDPQPAAILKLKVVDKAMGSGHFLVEAARFLGDALYEACRRCDDLAQAAITKADLIRKEGDAVVADAENARATDFLRRVERLPDPDDELLRYLPSRAVEGSESGFSLHKAVALCRRMIAVHCIYGVDKNPLAVELAKLALWIECHAEGLPLTFLDHRLVVGDSLTGPFFEHLLKYPGTQQPLDDLFTRGLTEKLTTVLSTALQHVRDLEATVGTTLADLELKQAAKARLDRALAPFHLLAAAWSGGVMLGPEGCDDTAYATLAKHIAEDGDLVKLDQQTSTNGLFLRMISKGLGIPYISDLRSPISDLCNNAIPALSYDLAFPEVFYPDGNATKRAGFDADMGNPPWDKVRPKAREFFAAFDLAVLDAPLKRERVAVENRLKSDPVIAALHLRYEEEFSEQHRVHDLLYKYQIAYVAGEKTGGDPDLAKYFMERTAHLLNPFGITGVVVPAAFHANEGATGIRRLYLGEMGLICCYSFENQRKLFEIDSRFKFAPIVATRNGPTKTFKCAFYLHDDEWLFTHREHSSLSYTLDFVRRTGGDYLSFIEPRNQEDVAIISATFNSGELFDTYANRAGFRFSRELDTTDDSNLFVPIDHSLGDPRAPLNLERYNAGGSLLLAEGRTFHQYDDRWDAPPRYLVPIVKIQHRASFIKSASYYRLVYRTISASTNERTCIFCLLPPGYTTARSSPSDVAVFTHPSHLSISLMSCVNSYTFDFLLRQIVSSMTVNYFFLARVPVPKLNTLVKIFLTHTGLRLTCNHVGYAPLWREQLGETWRETSEMFTWPVLSRDDARWAVRAAIDAVVAHSYGLNREQYAHVLSSFSHSSYRDAPRLCLAAFDELQQLGLEAFMKKHDPYWDIPLNEILPQPVIDLPMPQSSTLKEQGEAYTTGELFDFQTQPAPSGSGVLFTEQPIPIKPRKRSKK